MTTAYPVRGIDVSRWQDPATDGDMAGCAFVGIRATYGTTPDPTYPAHEANARKVGAAVLAYCFGRNLDGVDQARALVAAAPKADFYVLDRESDSPSPEMTPYQASACFAAMRQLSPKTRVLYASEAGFPQHLGQDVNWVASWGTTPPAIPWAFWQTSGSPLDRDVFNGSAADLRRLAGLEDDMLTAAPDTAATPWDQLVDLKPGTVITGVDGRKVPLSNGGSGVWSPFAASSTVRAVRFSTGGIAQLGTVPLAACANMRPRLAAAATQTLTVTGAGLTVAGPK